MSVALPTPDVTQFTAFTQGNESALKAIFRQEYEALISTANTMLGEELAHCAPRIVENAMLATWARRTEFAHPTGLAAFLETAVEEEAALQKRKHAALHHRGGAMPKHSTIPTPDEAIAALDRKLHETPPDHDTLIEEARAAKRRHAQEHVQAVGRSRPWVIPALIGVVAVAAIIGVQRWVGARGGDIAVTKALQSEEARVINSARGQRGVVTLVDDSRVRIGSDSRVRVPKEFGGNIRTVELTGTARFEVAEGRSTPFAVRALNTEVVATGTAFTVRAYPDESTTSVWVDEGSVTLRIREGDEERTLAAGEAVRVTRDGRIEALASDARDASFAWTRDSLVFDNAPLGEVLPALGRWFDLKLALADPALASRRVSVRLGLQSSGEALDAVAKAAGMVHGFDAEKQVVLKEK